MTEPKDGRFGPAGLTQPFELKFAVYNDTEWNKTFYRIPHNSHHNYNVKTGILKPVNTELHKWNLNQYKDDFKNLKESDKGLGGKSPTLTFEKFLLFSQTSIPFKLMWTTSPSRSLVKSILLPPPRI